MLAGLYDGAIDFGSLSTYGDFGIGTFDRFNGEMIGFDGSFYQIDSHGMAHRVSDAETTPFACVTFFEPDLSASLPHNADYASLSVFLTSFLPTQNLFYAIRVDGTFSYVKTRSVPAQEEPYRPLVDIVAEQPTFDFHHVEGTLIGFRCPEFVAGLNVAGDHLHFLTSDRTSGGHVLDVVIDEATLTVDITPAFETKMRAIRAYASQFDGAFEAGDILSNGRDDLYEQVSFRCRAYGALVQVPFGEPFLTDRPLVIDDLSAVGGRSI